MSDLSPRLRADLLSALDARYKQRLKDSLEMQARIALDLHTLPAAVAPQHRLHLYGPTRSRAIPLGTPIHQVFDDMGGELLILGAPGAGKTTLLLELARVLVARAQVNPTHPIPVVVNLASWPQHAHKREQGKEQVFLLQQWHQWLLDAIHTAAGVSKRVAAQLITVRHLLLLLDGLDEVAEGKRAACIAAINAYCSDQRPLRLVVCSRTAEYKEAGVRLELTEAVEIVPLTFPQVEAALADMPKAVGVLMALRDDSLLRALLTTPLMLNVILLAYAGQPLPQVQVQTVDEWQSVLFTAYVRRMFQQRWSVPYVPQDIIERLRWLAAQMQHDTMTEFLLEDLQPHWLPSRWRYHVITSLGSGMVGGLIGWGLGWMSGGPVVAMVVGSVFALGGMLLGAAHGEITLEEQVSWSRQRMAQQRWSIFGYGLVGALLGTGFGVVIPAWGVVACQIAGVLTGIVGRLALALATSRDIARLTFRTRPTEGIRASWRNGVQYGVTVGCLTGGMLGLAAAGTSGYQGWTMYGPAGGYLSAIITGIGVFVITGFSFGLTALLESGGGAVLKHYLLRYLLGRAGLLPWDAVGFLDTACDLLFLQRDGGIYRFRHILLRDYFASLTPEEVAALASGDDGGTR
jgi:DNA polymerase III delta prime subunit